MNRQPIPPVFLLPFATRPDTKTPYIRHANTRRTNHQQTRHRA